MEHHHMHLSYTLAVVAATLTPAISLGQSPSTRSAAPAPGSVVVLDVALYTAQANMQEATDTLRATLATVVLRGKLQELLGAAVVDSARTAQAAAAAATPELTGGKPCNVIVACAKVVAKTLGARWAVMAKVSKTSNLIWLLTGELIDVGTGELVLDDSTELKGDPDPMVRAGVGIFAERVARTVTERAVASH
jgi:hypothetical protein